MAAARECGWCGTVLIIPVVSATGEVGLIDRRLPVRWLKSGVGLPAGGDTRIHFCHAITHRRPLSGRRTIYDILPGSYHLALGKMDFHHEMTGGVTAEVFTREQYFGGTQAFIGAPCTLRRALSLRNLFSRFIAVPSPPPFSW